MQKADFLHAEGWESYWCVGKVDGYCGVATYCREAWKPLAVHTDATLIGSDEGLGEEGRLIVTDHGENETSRVIG